VPGTPSVDGRVSFNRMALPARIVSNGHTAALLSSLVTAAKRHHIDPFAYLREVEELLPDKWKAAQARGGRETLDHRTDTPEARAARDEMRTGAVNVQFGYLHVHAAGLPAHVLSHTL
jgi:hypothetical protein